MGECLASPHCLAVKELWKHMAGCMDASCMVGSVLFGTGRPSSRAYPPPPLHPQSPLNPRVLPICLPGIQKIDICMYTRHFEPCRITYKVNSQYVPNAYTHIRYFLFGCVLQCSVKSAVRDSVRSLTTARVFSVRKASFGSIYYFFLNSENPQKTRVRAWHSLIS